MADKTESSHTLLRRAVAAAERLGLNPERLECIALGYIALGYGFDSGAWRGELLDLVREAWGPVDVFDFAARYIPPVAGAAGRVCDGSLILADPRSGAEIFKSVASSRAERSVAALEAAPVTARGMDSLFPQPGGGS